MRSHCTDGLCSLRASRILEMPAVCCGRHVKDGQQGSLFEPFQSWPEVAACRSQELPTANARGDTSARSDARRGKLIGHELA
jgi:hypothetical protein